MWGKRSEGPFRRGQVTLSDNFFLTRGRKNIIDFFFTKKLFYREKN